MNKKAATLLMRSLVAAIIILLVATTIIVVFFGGPDSFYGKIGDYLEKQGRKFRPEETQSGDAKEIQIPENVRKFYVDLVTLLKENINKEETMCYIKYNKMPESNYQVVVEKSNKGTRLNLIYIKSDVEGDITIDSNEILEMTPCLVQGETEVDNFYHNWVDPGKCDSELKCKIPDFSESPGFSLKSPYELSQFKLDDQGILYKPLKGRICFIPTITRFFTKYNKNGIKKKYITQIKEKQTMQNCKLKEQEEQEETNEEILNQYLNSEIKDCKFIQNPGLLKGVLGEFEEIDLDVETVEYIRDNYKTYFDLIFKFSRIDPTPGKYSYSYLRNKDDIKSFTNIFKSEQYADRYTMFALHLWAVCTNGDGSYMDSKDYDDKYMISIESEDFSFESDNRYEGSTKLASEEYKFTNLVTNEDFKINIILIQKGKGD